MKWLENTCESVIDTTRLKNSMLPPPVPGNCSALLPMKLQMPWNCGVFDSNALQLPGTGGALLPMKLQMPWNCGVFDQNNLPDSLFFSLIVWSMLTLNWSSRNRDTTLCGLLIRAGEAMLPPAALGIMKFPFGSFACNIFFVIALTTGAP